MSTDQHVLSSDKRTLLLKLNATASDLIVPALQHEHVLGYNEEALVFIIHTVRKHCRRMARIVVISPSEEKYFLITVPIMWLIGYLHGSAGKNACSAIPTIQSNNCVPHQEVRSLPEAIAFLGYDWTLAEGF